MPLSSGKFMVPETMNNGQAFGPRILPRRTLQDPKRPEVPEEPHSKKGRRKLWNGKTSCNEFTLVGQRKLWDVLVGRNARELTLKLDVFQLQSLKLGKLYPACPQLSIGLSAGNIYKAGCTQFSTIHVRLCGGGGFFSEVKD